MIVKNLLGDEEVIPSFPLSKRHDSGMFHQDKAIRQEVSPSGPVNSMLEFPARSVFHKSQVKHDGSIFHISPRLRKPTVAENISKSLIMVYVGKVNLKQNSLINRFGCAIKPGNFQNGWIREGKGMHVLVNVIGISMVVSGIFLLIFTERTREFFKRVFLVENVKRLSFLPFSLGVILIAGAFGGQQFLWLPFILGLAGLAKGLYFFLASPNKVKTVMDWWFFKASPETIRFFGLISFVLGIGLLR